MSENQENPYYMNSWNFDADKYAMLKSGKFCFS